MAGFDPSAEADSPGSRASHTIMVKDLEDRENTHA